MKNNLLTVIPWLLLVAAVVWLSTFLINPKQDTNYEDIIKAKDETIQAVIRERDTYRQMSEQAIADLRSKDSLLQTRIKTNIIKYEQVPVIVANLSDSELRSAVENFR